MKFYSRLLLLIAMMLCIFTSCVSVRDSEVYITEALPYTTEVAEINSTSAPNTSNIVSEITTLPTEVIIPEPTSDPYVGMTKDEFYQNYTKATSYKDALYRSAHGFMSGSIELQDQKPTLADYQPKCERRYYRNTSALYSEDKNTYYIVNSYGEIVNTIYKGGGYVSLEEVAAYVYAFGEIPANYLAKKSASPASSIWGEYLRLNHSEFTGDTVQYPYEPELPNISGCGGTFCYYEIDIGTTGNDCDPKYKSAIYNNGTKITRGASRIVYTYSDLNRNKIIDPNEKFVFYTYNHYNDFQEYLNYEGGWGEMFGNITGGGKISSKTDYNPTPYIPTLRADFSKKAFVITVAVPYYIRNNCIFSYTTKKRLIRVVFLLFD